MLHLHKSTTLINKVNNARLKSNMHVLVHLPLIATVVKQCLATYAKNFVGDAHDQQIMY